MFKTVSRDASDAVPAGSDGCGLLRGPRPPGIGSILSMAALLAGLAMAAFWIDLPVAQWVRDRGFPGDLRRLVRLAEVFGWGGTVAIIILTAAKLDPLGWRVVPRLAACAFGAGLFADGLKLLVARLRPAAAALDGTALDTFVSWLPLVHRDRLGQAYGYLLQSFPSAHAATAVGLAVGLSALYPRGRWLFAGLAMLAGVQRIEARAHFTSDVLAGAAIGCVVAAAALGSMTFGSAGWLWIAQRTTASGTVVARQIAK